MNVLIIEDEKPSARRLERMLEKQNLSVTALLHTVKESIIWLNSNPEPELIFLDVQLSDGLSFEIFECISVKSAIIFTTAYDEYALKAFKLNSIDYLLKPIDEEELTQALEKFNHRHNQTTVVNFSELEHLLKKSMTPQDYRERFTVKLGQHLKMFSTEDIACFFSQHKATYLHTRDNRSYIVEDSLETLVETLDPKQFFRVSRKFIVHIDAIQDIVNYSNSRLKVKVKNYSDEPIVVSRERVRDFKNWLKV